MRGLYVVMLLLMLPVEARQWSIDASQSLQQALDGAVAGDTVLLAPGLYQGNFVVNKAISLIGSKGAIIDANGQGDGIRIKAAGVSIKQLQIIDWGDDLTAQNAGVYVEKQATDITISDNQLSGDGFGIYLDRTHDIKVINNHIVGNDTMRSADRGNGIQLSVVKNVEVRGNSISKARDGLYIISSQNNRLIDNKMSHLRYGIHFMYSHNNQVLNNLAHHTRAGYALMSSRHLTVTGNRSLDSEDYGFLMNFITYSAISNNHIDGVWTKPKNKVDGRDGKALFVYNSLFNTISHNFFANSFVNNSTQVKYVANREQQWSEQQQGNYWSNYLGWDLNDDGKGDVPFEPNDGIDKLLWQYPQAKVLMDSPAILVLRWVQRQFPVLKPAGVKDSYPLMHPASTVTGAF